PTRSARPDSRRLAAGAGRDREESRCTRAVASRGVSGAIRERTLCERDRHPARRGRGAARRVWCGGRAHSSGRRSALRQGALAPGCRTSARYRKSGDPMRSKFLLPFLALTACGKPRAFTTTPVRAKAIHVETTVVQEQPMPNTLVLAGSLKANQESELAA